MIRLLFSIFFALTLAHAEDAVPHYHSLILRDAKTNEFRGSATRLCPTTHPEKLFYLTDAHVVDRSNGLIGDNKLPLKLEYIESSMDLAVLSSPRAEFQFDPGCFTPYALLQDYPYAYDIEATENLPQHHLAIEALDVPSGKLKRSEFYGSIALSHSNGIPGREGTGALMMVSGHAILGNSGGSLIEIRDGFSGPEDSLLGIILAVDPAGRKMAVLPNDVLSARAMAVTRELSIHPSRELEKKIDGGIEYLDSGAIHYRSGTSGMVDSGPAGHSDGGPAGHSDGGPAGHSDGGVGDSQAVLFSSGITTPDHSDRRWLSIGDFWSEAEPYPLSERAALKNPGRLQGIYEEAGKLFATSGSASLPKFLDRAKDDAENPCSDDRAMLRQGEMDPHVEKVLYCEQGDGTERTLVLAREEASHLHGIRIELKKLCAVDENGVCPLELRAYEFVAAKNTSFSELKKLPLNPSSQLNSDGLRTFWNKKIWFNIQATGGYQWQIRQDDRLETLTGPVIENLSPTSDRMKALFATP